MDSKTSSEVWNVLPSALARERSSEERGVPAHDLLDSHSRLLIESHRRVVGRDLLGEDSTELEAWAPTEPPTGPSDLAEGHEPGRALMLLPKAVVSHGVEPEPVFNYGNALALHCFELTWHELRRLSSKRSAEPVAREERQHLLDRVRRHGVIDDYSGIRISAEGKRFWIEKATVWNVVDAAGEYRGQAACFAHWRPLTG